MTPHASISAIEGGLSLLITGHMELAFRRLMHGPTVSRDRRFVRLETGTDHPFGNFALMCDPADETATGDAIEPLVRRNAPAAVLFVGAVCEPVAQQLAGAGFERAGGLPAMAVDIADKLAKTRLPDGYSFARLSDVAHRDAWIDTFARGYGLPLPVGAAFAGGIDGDASAAAPVQYFWVLKGDVPVCTSIVFLENGVAGIYGVATLPEERKKGLAAHATAEPLRIARELGYRVGVLQASAEGQPVYHRLGFADFGEIPLFVRMPV